MPYKPERYRIQNWFDVIDHEGFLAVTLGWEICNDTPEEKRIVQRSDIPVDYYTDLLGHQIFAWSGNRTVIYKNDRRFRIDVTSWDVIEERRPIKKPRAGKRQGDRYDWKWEPMYVGASGRWVQYWID